MFPRIRRSRWPYIGLFLEHYGGRTTRKLGSHYLTTQRGKFYTRNSGGTFQNANDGWYMIMKVSEMIFSLICPSCPLVSCTFFLFITFWWLARLFFLPAYEQNVTGNWNKKRKLRVVLFLQRDQRNKGTLWSIWVTLFLAFTLGLDQSPSQSLALTSQLPSLTLCLSGWMVVSLASAAGLQLQFHHNNTRKSVWD